ncbi:hypothetical protein L3Q82_015276 [Scortum barcoo]|uniref:Uncharacterized protein n=1 Tax=Scortum barcoo TaxID=214431 RepID=A0ACB8VTT0_9TELE|nr:hypothetical protein L3Q82_015276 [Scortum barcoo]
MCHFNPLFHMKLMFIIHKDILHESLRFLLKLSNSFNKVKNIILPSEMWWNRNIKQHQIKILK